MDKKFTRTVVETPKAPNPFVKALKRIFVHNIGYKAFAIVLSAAIWVLSVGLA